MTRVMEFCVPGTLGSNGGPASDGVFVGELTPVAPAKAILASHSASPLCFADDGGAYTNYDTAINNATADDVPALPAVPAVDDAFYVGHATSKFGRVDLTIGTAGVGTWTVAWEYWNGTAWVACTTVVDGTTAFKATAGTVSVTFDEATAWAKCTVDGVNAYWVRARVATYSAVTTQPLLSRGYIVLGSPGFTDDTTDFGDADSGDVALLPAYPIANDAFYIGHTEKFCKIKTTTSQARTGTATLVWEYWNGSAWATITTLSDDSIGWSASAGSLFTHFNPPSSWTSNTAANGPNGEAGYFVRCRLSEITTVTQQPLATRGYVYPIATGATGIASEVTGTITKVQYFVGTKSGSTADSKFLLLNIDTGIAALLTLTKGVAIDSETISLVVTAGQKLALIQIAEDGTTEFAAASFMLAT